ncbi:MAG: DUF547 domain-containing protein [Endozoicomonas sp.]
MTTKIDGLSKNGAAFRAYLLTALFLLMAPALNAAPKSEYWAIWDKSDASSQKVFDHSSWSPLLSRYLSEPADGSVRLFDYKSVSASDRKQLQAYIASLSGVDPRTYRKSEQMAYWINLYNALTVELILKHYPVKTITKIGSWYQFGPWDEEIVTVAGQKLTLNDIEHRILRPIWKDKRIHYAVNCASRGCPDLAMEAFTGAELEGQLEEAARRFINQEKAVEFIDGRLALSQIYEWYVADFGDRAALMKHFLAHLQPPLSEKLKKYTGPLDYQYDWSLNDRAPSGNG